ncbi:MBL fold metallo-hydrolase [Phyllobacterium salinisoli]|uniref:MBL fold metallo-hydrolase n=1 Tax=Phyllobacterium salinisoli TaxID=1899321 RepID=A0A368JZR2_9HYPH|nr:MBL fold metallo-hydrolase [Phyllobacterium salinisoli]RCS22629.1 MBL fold metallo-hydrolase [Phyllobacterium salinisoli]
MDDERLLVKFWGVRGSVPVSGAEFLHYGGNTACVELICGGHRLFLDAGSGLRLAGEALRAAGVTDIDLFFTHCHYDHIIGFPFFTPIHDKNCRITVWSGHLAGRMTTRQMLSEFMLPPWFPAKLDICKANIACNDFVSGAILQPREGITIRTASLNHPGGCIGYRVEWGGRAIALISDTEHEPGQLDAAILGLIEDADLVIYDCTYIEPEMERYRGFGHSTWQQGVRLCEAAGARGLALFHHDPKRSDGQLEIIEQQAKDAFAGAFAARDGQELEFPRFA